MSEYISDIQKRLQIEFDAHTIALLIKRNDLKPGGLFPGADYNEIMRVAKQTRNDFKYLYQKDQLKYRELWHSFCESVYQPHSSPPEPSQLYLRIRNMLFNAVEQANFIFDALVDPCIKNYVGDTFLELCKKMLRDDASSYSFYGYAYSKSSSKKQYQTACRYLAMDMGLASVALKDGLEPFFATATLPSQYHKSCAYWNGATPDQSAKLLKAKQRKLDEWARKRRIRYERIWSLEAQGDGTPHIHVLIFTDQPEIVEAKFRAIFADDVSAPGGCGIDFKKARNVKACVRYINKTHYGPHKFHSDKAARLVAWSRNIRGKRRGKGSTVRYLLPVKIWEDARRGRTAIEAGTRQLVIDLAESNDGTSYVTLAGGQYAVDSDAITDLLDEEKYRVRLHKNKKVREQVTSQSLLYAQANEAITFLNQTLHKAAAEGDYAQAQRLYESATNARKISPLERREGPSVMAWAGAAQIATISKYKSGKSRKIQKLLAESWDVEDTKWLLRHNFMGKRPSKLRQSLKKATDFLHALEVSLAEGHQMSLKFS